MPVLVSLSKKLLTALALPTAPFLVVVVEIVFALALSLALSLAFVVVDDTAVVVVEVEVVAVVVVVVVVVESNWNSSGSKPATKYTSCVRSNVCSTSIRMDTSAKGNVTITDPHRTVAPT